VTLLTVHLLRHGEVHNPDQVLYGRLPGFGLSERGRAMAERAAEVIARVPDSPARVGVLVTSPLQRARETAVPLERALGLTARVDPRVIEGSNDFEGHHVDGAFLRRPENLRRLWNPWRPSWGEPHRQIADRMWAALDQAAAEAAAAGRAVLVVSHQLPIWSARRSAEHRRIWGRRECALASLTTFTLDLPDAPTGPGPTSGGDAAAAGPDAAAARPDAGAAGHPSARSARAAVVAVDYSEPAAGL